VEAAGAKVEMNPSDLLKAQYSLMQVSVQQDVTSKVVGKATQTLDTLLKNQ
jgi:type III secretion system YscI/HrpB-like protein